MNNKGPSLDPWGTPELTLKTSDLDPSTTTTLLASCEKDKIPRFQDNCH